MSKKPKWKAFEWNGLKMTVLDGSTTAENGNRSDEANFWGEHDTVIKPDQKLVMNAVTNAAMPANTTTRIHRTDPKRDQIATGADQKKDMIATGADPKRDMIATGADLKRDISTGADPKRDISTGDDRNVTGASTSENLNYDDPDEAFAVFLKKLHNRIRSMVDVHQRTDILFPHLQCHRAAYILNCDNFDDQGRCICRFKHAICPFGLSGKCHYGIKCKYLHPGASETSILSYKAQLQNGSWRVDDITNFEDDVYFLSVEGVRWCLPIPWSTQHFRALYCDLETTTQVYGCVVDARHPSPSHFYDVWIGLEPAYATILSRDPDWEMGDIEYRRRLDSFVLWNHGRQSLNHQVVISDEKSIAHGAFSGLELVWIRAKSTVESDKESPISRLNACMVRFLPSSFEIQNGSGRMEQVERTWWVLNDHPTLPRPYEPSRCKCEQARQELYLVAQKTGRNYHPDMYQWTGMERPLCAEELQLRYDLETLPPPVDSRGELLPNSNPTVQAYRAKEDRRRALLQKELQLAQTRAPLTKRQIVLPRTAYFY